MDMKGDLVSNWEFLRDSWQNYAAATKLGDKDKKIVAATLLSMMGKECLHLCRNLPMTAEERQDATVILTKLSEYFIQSEIDLQTLCAQLSFPESRRKLRPILGSASQTRRHM